jgi:hypothetical protein
MTAGRFARIVTSPGRFPGNVFDQRKIGEGFVTVG